MTLARNVAFFLLLLIPAGAGALTIRSDPFWIENPQCPSGWQQPDADLSTWRAVDFPWLNIWPREWPPDVASRPLWGNGPYRSNCLRRSFELTVLPSGPAELKIWVDDDYDLYLNGTLVGASHDFTSPFPGEQYDVSSKLRVGTNVIALKSIDNVGVKAVLLSLALPGIPEESRSWAQELRRFGPWLKLAAVALALVLLAFVTNRLGRWLQQRLLGWRPASRVLALLAAAGCCQLVLSGRHLYRGSRPMPVADWDWTWTAIALLLFVLTMSLAAVVPPASSANDNGKHATKLIGVVILAVALRTLWLDDVPVGFFQDDATNAIDALHLAETPGIELWSDSIGGRPTLFLYAIALGFEAFGKSYLTLKIAPVVFGCATVLALYWMLKVGVSARAALWGALLIAAARWHIHFSRQPWEAICVPFFSAAGAAFLLAGLMRKRRSAVNLVLAAVFLGLGLYTYASYRALLLVVVAFFASLAGAEHRELLVGRWRQLAIAAAVGLAISAPLFVFAIQNPDLYWYRYSEVSLTSYMSYFGTPMPWVHQIGRSLLSFGNVGDELVRHNLPWAAHLDPITSTLMMTGFGLSIWGWRRLPNRLLVLWFCIFLAIASLTREGPHATRLFGLVVPAISFAAIAVVTIFEHLRVPFGVAAALGSAVVAINSYQYFAVEAYDPAADRDYDLMGRALCDYLRTHGPADLYWSEEVGFYSDGQCQFLVPGFTREQSKPVSVAELRSGALARPSRATVVALGREFVESHAELLATDPLAPPRVSLPVKPIIFADRRGAPMFYLYHFGPAR